MRLSKQFNVYPMMVNQLLISDEDRTRFYSGTFQPSNEMKLTFYGLYKQATIGPSQESRPSILNYVNRAKW